MVLVPNGKCYEVEAPMIKLVLVKYKVNNDDELAQSEPQSNPRNYNGKQIKIDRHYKKRILG